MTRRSRAHLLVLPAAAVLLFTGACARTGDFGRPDRDPVRPAFYQEWAHELSGLFKPKRQAYPLATEERELRARAWRFVHHDAEQTLAWDWHMDEDYRIDLFKDHEPRAPERYYIDLTHPPSRAPVSLWNALIGDITTDIDLLVPLSETAFLVADLDRERLYRRDHAKLTGEHERVLVDKRAAANRKVIDQVRIALGQRLDAYAYALEKGEIDLPDLREIQARRALLDLGDLAGRLDQILLIYDGGAAYAAPAAGKRLRRPIEEVYRK